MVDFQSSIQTKLIGNVLFVSSLFYLNCQKKLSTVLLTRRLMVKSLIKVLFASTYPENSQIH